MDIPRLHCLKCHHTWIPRQQTPPKQCPCCTDKYWNREYSRPISVTKSVIAKLQACRFALCKRRLFFLNSLAKGEIVKGANTKPDDPRTSRPRGRTRNPNQWAGKGRKSEITKGNLPEGFTLIK